MEGWQQSTHDKFQGVYPESLLLFYINHLGSELAKMTELFAPLKAAPATSTSPA